MRHTPGPWAVSTSDGEAYWVCSSAEGKNEFGDMACTKEEMKANASLIAAAPDMLKALEEALTDSSFEDGHAKLTMDTLDLIRAAIAKARGEQDNV
jgi:hypothetical protein